MKCPVCTEENLIMSDRQGVEIDYCPKCRGVWLDRGELDKIIERATGGTGSQEQEQRHQTVARPVHSPPPPPPPQYARRDDDSVDEDVYDDRYRRRKKKGWLGEIFDFD
jgi:Zn-finger nucleic acid-binding protein